MGLGGKSGKETVYAASLEVLMSEKGLHLSNRRY